MEPWTNEFFSGESEKLNAMKRAWSLGMRGQSWFEVPPTPS